MKVQDARAGLLSNFEVLDLLRCRGVDKGPLSSLLTSELQVYDYLMQTPAATQNWGAVESFLADAAPMQLTAAEKLQVLNCRPSSEVEVHLLIEDCDERLSGDQVETFLATVKRTLPPPPASDVGVDVEEDGGGDAAEQEPGDGEGDMEQ